MIASELISMLEEISERYSLVESIDSFSTTSQGKTNSGSSKPQSKPPLSVHIMYLKDQRRTNAPLAILTYWCSQWYEMSNHTVYYTNNTVQGLCAYLCISAESICQTQFQSAQLLLKQDLIAILMELRGDSNTPKDLSVGSCPHCHVKVYANQVVDSICVCGKVFSAAWLVQKLQELFPGGVTVRELQELTGHSAQTIRKHCLPLPLTKNAQTKLYDKESSLSTLRDVKHRKRVI